MQMRCAGCRKEVETRIEKRMEHYPVKGMDIQIEATVRVCTVCGKAIWDDDLDNQNLIAAFNDYRREKGLLMPEEIRAIREKYGLSQMAFARVLGLGDKTIARYENGSIQDEAQNNLIYLIADEDNFKCLFEKNKHRLTDGERALFAHQTAQVHYTIRQSEDNAVGGWTWLKWIKNIPAQVLTDKIFAA
ncbi:MAG: type II toxin-antitoxin system MqsA family antitoxin [Clostridia bacterium]